MGKLFSRESLIVTGVIVLPAAFLFLSRHLQAQYGGISVLQGLYGAVLVFNAVLAYFVLRTTGERKRAITQLELKGRQLAEAQDVAKLGSWEWDAVSDRFTWSDELFLLYGIPRESFSATFGAFLEHVHQGDRAAVEGVLKQAIRDFQPFSFSYRVIRNDGAILILHAQGRVIVDGGVRVVGTAQDLTELKNAERALHEMQKRFQLLVEEIQDYAIFMLDVHGYVASWNAGAERIKGYAAADVIGRHFSCFYTALDAYSRKPERLLLAAIAGGRVEDEGWRVRKDGSCFWADVTITASHDADGKIIGFSKIVRDLSERKHAEEEVKFAHGTLESEVRERTAELLERNEELRRLNEARLAFTSMVSHELRTPLSSIKAGIDMILQGVDGPVNSGQKETLSITQVNVDRLSRLINNVLDYTRLETGRMEMQFSVTDVDALVFEVFELMKMDAEHKGVEFSLKRQGSGILAECDADKMKTVVLNLIHNAIKFTDGKGRVEVSVGTVEDGAVRVEVKDNGVGIPAAEQKNIFQMFHQASSSGIVKSGGSGVGLAVCKFIVDQHGGSLEVVSRLGEGSCFSVTFPRMHSAPSEARLRQNT